MSGCVIVSSKGTRAWQGIPTIERASDGRLLCAFFSGGPEEPHVDNEILLTTSEDDGETWSEPEVIISPCGNTRAFDPCLWHDPAGKLWLFYNLGDIQTPKHSVMAITCLDSNCETLEWSSPIELELNLPFAFRLNKPTVVSNGNWLLPVTYMNEPLGVKKDREIWFGGGAQLQGVAISSDAGATWRLRGALKAPYWALENMVIEKTDGTLWMLIRTGGGFLWESYSTDLGESWSPAEATDIPNPGSRFFIRRLSSGELLMINHADFVKNDEFPRGRHNLAAMFSDDDGASWSKPIMLDPRNEVAYPDAVEAPDGTIYVVHDRDRKNAGEIILRRLKVC